MKFVFFAGNNQAGIRPATLPLQLCILSVFVLEPSGQHRGSTCGQSRLPGRMLFWTGLYDIQVQSPS